MSSRWMLNVTILLLILSTSLLHEAKAEDEENENEAMINSEDDFKELVDSSSAFVMFFAPWCGHCSRLKPAWDQLTKDINSDETIPMQITKVDCTKNTKLCSSEGVMGYPTLKLYRVGEEAVRHKGGRDVVSLKKFVMEHVEGGDKSDEASPDEDEEDDGSASTHVEGLYDLTNDNFNAHVKRGYHFVKFYAPWCGHCRRLEPAWKDLAKLFEPKDDNPKVTIGRVDCTSNKAICTQHSVRGYPTLLMLKDGKKVADYESGRDLKSLETFVKKSIGDSVEEEETNVEEDDDDVANDVDTGSFDLTTDSFSKHVRSGFHFVKFYAPWCGHCRKLEPTWTELAKLYANSNDVRISRIDCTEHQPICGQYQVRGYPTLLLLKDSKLVEKYQGSRDLNAFKKFLGDKTGVKDETQDDEEDEDEEEKESGLHVLTSATFDQHVASGYHFVKFYAPWCGHCKRLEPTWDLLAEVYKDSNDVTIAKIDCTASGEVCSKFEVRGYPTLLFIKDGKTLEKYRGARDLPSFQDFIKSKLSGEIDPAAASGGEKKSEGGHVGGLFDLTSDNFDKHVASGYHFVKFYAPWCGHCKRLEPTWAELAKLHKPVDDKPEVTIARIDCTANQATCSKYEVRGYPSLLLFKDGEKVAKYQGSRELNKLEDYLKAEMSGAKAEDADVKGVLYLHASNFDFSTATDATFVMFYAPWCGFCKKLKPVWMEVATSSDFSSLKTPVKIANVDCTKNAPLCAQYQVTGYPTLMLFVEGQSRGKYSGSREKDALVKYVIDELSKPQADPEPVEQEEDEKEEEEKEEKIRDEL